MFLHNNFNSIDYINIRRDVSLQIALTTFKVFIKRLTEKFCSNVFGLQVDQPTFFPKFDCCDPTLNTILARNISLPKRRNGLV